MGLEKSRGGVQGRRRYGGKGAEFSCAPSGIPLLQTLEPSFPRSGGSGSVQVSESF